MTYKNIVSAGAVALMVTAGMASAQMVGQGSQPGQQQYGYPAQQQQQRYGYPAPQGQQMRGQPVSPSQGAQPGMTSGTPTPMQGKQMQAPANPMKAAPAPKGTPGVPNTGAGGDAMQNMLALSASSLVVLLGASFLMRTRSRRS